MELIRVCVAAILLALAVALPTTSIADSLTVRAGIGYDFLSQEYFVDTSLLIDSVEANLALKTEYLDDFKGLVNLAYYPFSDRRLELNAVCEQTRDDSRVRLWSNLRTKSDHLRFDMRNELDWRRPTDDSSETNNGYAHGYTQARLRVPVSTSTTLWCKGKADFVQFDQVSTYSQDYYRLGGHLGVTHTFASLSSFDLSLSTLYRQVPDSTQLDYRSIGLESAFFGFYTNGEVDIYARLESKNYNQTEKSSDYRRLEVDGRHKLRLANGFFSRQIIDLELTDFLAEDYVSYDYTRIGLTLMGGWEGEQISLAGGPDLELLTERNLEQAEGQDYFESGLKIDLDLILPSSVFASLESVTGFRNLENESSLQSDFTFERIYLVADWTLMQHLNMDIMLSAEWEWHDNQAENNRILMLSTGISYRF